MIVSVSTLAQPVDEGDVHSQWDAILSQYLQVSRDGINRFDYAGLRDSEAHRESLNQYIILLEAATPSQMSDDEAFAYWANLYNAVTVRLIVEEAPEHSIRQIRPRLFSTGPWGADRVTVEGERLSLDNIEHDIMRDRYNARLVHYAVNCASIGCPNLKPTAWRVDTLQADLEEGARAYINHPRGVTVTDRGLVVSSIYRWYQEDFEDSREGVISHLLNYSDPELASAIRSNPRIVDYEYDWALNRSE